MVADQRLSEEPKNISEEDYHSDGSDYDDVSTGSSCQDESMEVVPANEQPVGNFGNIVVKDSSDVHFGNKTFYQGPVTIKQFLYNNTPSDTKLCIEEGCENPNLVTDSACSVSNKGVINGINGNVSNGINNGVSHLPETVVRQG